MSDALAELESLDQQAFAAFDRGELGVAVPLFQRLAETYPGRYAYMLGLAHKYRREWKPCIEQNLRAIAASAKADDLQAEHWNTAIAASALGEWTVAREHWIAAGVDVSPGDAPMNEDRGVISVRLNAWDSGETLYANRIGLARAQLRNVPLPNSGHRYGDLVLIDGACTGERHYGNSTVPVFNALQRLEPSEFQTYELRVDCATVEDAEALEEATEPGIACVEDWSRSMVFHCTACSYGLPHQHAEREPDETGWVRERRVGVAASSREAVDMLIEGWLKDGRNDGLPERLAGRRPTRALLEVQAIDTAEPRLPDKGKWWVAPGEDPGG